MTVGESGIPGPENDGQEPVAAPSAEQGAVVKTMKRSIWKSRVPRVWAVIVAVVTLITSVVSIWPILFKDESNAQSLSVKMKPFRAESVAHFALPVGAPIETFPTGGPLCSQAQEEWLQQHGVRFQRDYLVELRNTAGGGGSLAVSNFHGVAKSSVPGKASYVVECDKTGDGGVVTEPARLLLDSGEGAFFDKSVLGAAGTGQPNSPLAYNLRPGETGQIVLTLSAVSGFEGDVVASVAAGNDTAEVKVSTMNGDPVKMPGLISPRTILVSVADGTLNCHVVPNPSALIDTCNAKDLFTAK